VSGEGRRRVPPVWPGRGGRGQAVTAQVTARPRPRGAGVLPRPRPTPSSRPPPGPALHRDPFSRWAAACPTCHVCRRARTAVEAAPPTDRPRPAGAAGTPPARSWPSSWASDVGRGWAPQAEPALYEGVSPGPCQIMLLRSLEQAGSAELVRHQQISDAPREPTAAAPRAATGRGAAPAPRLRPARGVVPSAGRPRPRLPCSSLGKEGDGQPRRRPPPLSVAVRRSCPRFGPRGWGAGGAVHLPQSWVIGGLHLSHQAARITGQAALRPSARGVVAAGLHTERTRIDRRRLEELACVRPLQDGDSAGLLREPFGVISLGGVPSSGCSARPDPHRRQAVSAIEPPGCRPAPARRRTKP
jgi:hypothetical protein